MKDISILSINIRDNAELLISDHQSAKSAYRKIPVQSEAIRLGMEGFEGDMVNDTKHHGGNDKAICCYNSDHFPYWKEKLNVDLSNAAFGENLTLSGDSASESNIYIGDRYALGGSVVEVSEPRGPCYMIGIRHNLKKFDTHLRETGFTGFYLRTIKPGIVRTTDKLIHIHANPEKISVMTVNEVRYHDPLNKEWLSRLVNLETLTLEWRERFSRMLARL